MRDIKISEEIKKRWPNTVLGVLYATVKVNESCEELINEIDDYCNGLKEELNLTELVEERNIRAGREAYKALGKSPSKYRLSSEALIRRILQGKGLYRVNNIVDINNLISIKTKHPVGSYDLSNVGSSLVLDRAKEGEKYKGIGKELLNIEFLPVLIDEKGAFGSPTSDSERAMIRETSEEIIMCIYSFNGEAQLEEYLVEARRLLEKYASGSNFAVKMVKI